MRHKVKNLARETVLMHKIDNMEDNDKDTTEIYSIPRERSSMNEKDLFSEAEYSKNESDVLNVDFKAIFKTIGKLIIISLMIIVFTIFLLFLARYFKVFNYGGFVR